MVVVVATEWNQFSHYMWYRRENMCYFYLNYLMFLLPLTKWYYGNIPFSPVSLLLAPLLAQDTQEIFSKSSPQVSYPHSFPRSLLFPYIIVGTAALQDLSVLWIFIIYKTPLSHHYWCLLSFWSQSSVKINALVCLVKASPQKKRRD